MTQPGQANIGVLGHQSLRRALTDAEQRLANALAAIFGAGRHEFAQVADELQRQAVARPSRATGPWTPETLEYELKRINDSLDRAYNRQPDGDNQQS